MNGPLDGIRVLEVANWLAAPAAGALLADMGADVIKVEAPGGDPWRYFRLHAAGFSGHFPENVTFEVDNRGKRSITVNLDTDEGAALVRSLASSSDVLITNLLPTRVEKYGLQYERLAEGNPRLIYAYFNGYGPKGPEKNRPGFDYAAFWARPGIMSLVGEEGDSPPLQRPGMGDHTTSILFTTAILTALFARERSGEGQFLDVSLYGAGVWTLATDIQAAIMTGQEPSRNRRTGPANPLWNTYPTGDGKWLMLVMVQPDPYWPKICRALELSELVDDPRFATFEARAANSPELVAIFEREFRRFPRDEWGKRLDAAGTIWAPVGSITDVISDPQAEANGFFRTVDHDTYGSLRLIDTPMNFSKSHVHARGPAPVAGQHTEEVLLGAGLSWDDITALREKGVFG